MKTSDKPPILVIGAGRLITRVLHELSLHFGSDHSIVHIPSKAFKENEETDVQEASIQSAAKILKSHGIEQARAVVLACSMPCDFRIFAALWMLASCTSVSSFSLNAFDGIWTML